MYRKACAATLTILPGTFPFSQKKACPKVYLIEGRYFCFHNYCLLVVIFCICEDVKLSLWASFLSSIVIIFFAPDILLEMFLPSLNFSNIPLDFATALNTCLSYCHTPLVSKSASSSFKLSLDPHQLSYFSDQWTGTGVTSFLSDLSTGEFFRYFFHISEHYSLMPSLHQKELRNFKIYKYKANLYSLSFQIMEKITWCIFTLLGLLNQKHHLVTCWMMQN